MKAFLTGSMKYGNPSSKSDIDLVVLMEPREFQKFISAVHFKDSSQGKSVDQEEYKWVSGNFRFGDLNLIVCTTEEQYQVWQEGTEQCLDAKEKSPDRICHREVARFIFNQLRRKAGLPES